MVAKQHPLEKSARAIEASLIDLTGDQSDVYVDVAANKWGHLDVVVGTDMYQGVSLPDRVDRVMDYLQQSLDPADFANVSQVWVLDIAEYEAVLRFGDSAKKILDNHQSEED